VTELSLPPVKIHCSVLAEDAIKAAIADYKKKKGTSAEKGAGDIDTHAQPTA
jgi:nitrogen fixation NifU-like protein